MTLYRYLWYTCSLELCENTKIHNDICRIKSYTEEVILPCDCRMNFIHLSRPFYRSSSLFHTHGSTYKLPRDVTIRNTRSEWVWRKNVSVRKNSRWGILFEISVERVLCFSPISSIFLHTSFLHVKTRRIEILFYLLEMYITSVTNEFKMISTKFLLHRSIRVISRTTVERAIAGNIIGSLLLYRDSHPTARQRSINILISRCCGI